MFKPRFLLLIAVLLFISMPSFADSLKVVADTTDALASGIVDAPAEPSIQKAEFNFMSVARGLLGICTLVLIAFLFSNNRKAINWRLVIIGLGLQFTFAILVLKVYYVEKFFDYFSSFFVTLLSFTKAGSSFLFGEMVNIDGSLGYVFAFQILPTIIFFSALTSVLFYLGILQKLVYVFAWVMKKTMGLSGAESLAAAGNIFIGQTEAPLLIKPYIEKMTRSELLCLMSGGMATIAGGVLGAYIVFLGGKDEAVQLFYAKHLLAASIMSAPAAIVVAKILIPETEKINEELTLPKEKLGSNVLEAISNGTVDGIKLAVNVGGMLLVFIAFIAMFNYLVQDKLGALTGLNEWAISFSEGRYDGFSLQFILGYICAPLVWLLGICKEDMVLVGQLLGEKTVLNEFIAYATLGEMKVENAFHEQKSIIMSTYILCGFANFASIGIQIGGIGVLAPSRRSHLSQLGLRALLGGALACLFTAVIVGMLM